jgi:hypothetical protein
MKLSHFAVVHERGGAAAMLDDPLVHCFADKQVVLTYVSRQALMDFFQVPGDRLITLAQWNLVVDRNLDAFKRIIETKYARGDWGVHNTLGQSFPKLVITLEDMQTSGQEFTIEVLNLDAGFWPRVSSVA